MKINAIALLDFEFTSNDIEVQHVSHYAIETLPISKVVDVYSVVVIIFGNDEHSKIRDRAVCVPLSRYLGGGGGGKSQFIANQTF